MNILALGPASNVHIPELGDQRCVPLGVSKVTLALLVFFFFFCLFSVL